MNPDIDTVVVELKSPGQGKSRPITLCDHVRIAVDQYLQQINGHPTCNLYDFVIAEVERPLIETVLKHVGHNQSKAAKALGISRSTLRKKIDRYRLD